MNFSWKNSRFILIFRLFERRRLPRRRAYALFAGKIKRRRAKQQQGGRAVNGVRITFCDERRNYQKKRGEREDRRRRCKRRKGDELFFVFIVHRPGVKTRTG